MSTGAALVLAAGGASAAFAAGPSDGPSAAATELCTDLTTLNSDTAALNALNPSTATKDQVKDAYTAVQDDWEAVAKSTATWEAAQKDAVKTAADALKKSYQGLPGDTTGSEAVTTLKPQAQSLDAAVKAARTGLSCPS
ncbi:hypothetical protein [Streptomyces sp. NBC_01565]|uniref:hypothetical protein n=1 Tax=unclassified Streptomyces TaxID=2593676 RepID=UPI0022551DBE|nr:hypothetical protein [Streptomyces sp. NBC_01565]MCX4539501.1 hypothetical protein [Streptomyces sp. NBC_01565]